MSNDQKIIKNKVGLLKLAETPKSHRQLDIPQAHTEVEVQPHALRDDLFRKPITTIRADRHSISISSARCDSAHRGVPPPLPAACAAAWLRTYRALWYSQHAESLHTASALPATPRRTTADTRTTGCASRTGQQRRRPVAVSEMRRTDAGPGAPDRGTTAASISTIRELSGSRMRKQPNRSMHDRSSTATPMVCPQRQAQHARAESTLPASYFLRKSVASAGPAPRALVSL